MNIHDSAKYKDAKIKEAELRGLLLDLDSVAELLYNNLSYSGVWKTIQLFEEVRIEYYVLHHEYNSIVKNKGKLDGK